MRSPALLVLPLALVAAACGSSSSSNKSGGAYAPATTSSSTSTSGGATRLATQRLPSVGAVLTNGRGHSLYVYMPEKGGKVVCTGGCASLWPPMLAPSSGNPATSSVVHPNLVGTVASRLGRRIVTYAGWPLHTYASDTSAGTANGQGYGGKWFLISPSGQVITRSVGSATNTTGTSTSSGGSGSGGGSGY